jgi:nicotinamidase-related amidase
MNLNKCKPLNSEEQFVLIFRIFALCQIFASVPVFSNGIALLVIDVQNCFLPTGSLPVPDGDTVIPIINDIRKKYDKLFSLVVFSQDWHCVNHVSFASQHSEKTPYETMILQYNNEGRYMYITETPSPPKNNK